MSFLGLGSGGQSHQPSAGAINSQQLEMAVAELDMITDVFNRLVSYVLSSRIRRPRNHLTVFGVTGPVMQNA